MTVHFSALLLMKMVMPGLGHHSESSISPAEGFSGEVEHYLNSCRKESVTAPSWIAGLFHACCTHGVMYGFHFMKHNEGRKDLFYPLFHYWPKDKLDNLTVIYDFACQAHDYVLNHEPYLFENVKFFMDRFHQVNHKCSGIYWLDAFPALFIK
jgi:hypothetical protein